MTSDVPDLPLEVTEKLDGSLIVIWFHHGRWNISTRGSFDSPQAQWAQEWCQHNVLQSSLRTNVTYLAEAVYPENRIVVNYPEQGLFLLSAYNRETGEEPMSHDTLDFAAAQAGFRRPKVFRHRLMNCLPSPRPCPCRPRALSCGSPMGFVSR